jgi:hypothetical protein
LAPHQERIVYGMSPFDIWRAIGAQYMEQESTGKALWVVPLGRSIVAMTIWE